jgi:flotillin
MDMLLLIGSVLGVLGFTTLIAFMLRRVVPTNEVHIVQSARKTTSYGKDTGNGNTYYEWPSFLPLIGVTKTKFPTSVFDLDLEAYEAYDKGRLPFIVDVKAFFRITDSNVAAQRVANFQELHNQLKAIVQGAVRVILASNDIETILQGRSTFGEQFTKEVTEQLAHWGVGTVKNIELMDIRDSQGSAVIKNIMEKKKSQIEMESRTEVAKNKQIAQMAEIEAQKEVDLQAQSAKQAVGLRTVEAEKEVQLQRENAAQSVKEQAKLTKEKEMAIARVEQTRKAEIEKEVQIVRAEQAKQTTLIEAEAKKKSAITLAEAEKEQVTLVSEGQLEAKKRESEGITLEGTARANAEKAMQLAPVEAQITLAKEIGSNESYQKYLITIRRVEADQAVGIAQAAALQKADVKVISNTGSPTNGVKSVMDLFSSQGGTALGSALEALSQTEAGSALLGKLTGSEEKASTSNSAAKPSSNGKALSNGSNGTANGLHK